MKTIRFGILATGDIAARLADTIATVDHAEVLAVGSRDLEKAQAFAKAHNIPRCVRQLRRALQRSRCGHHLYCHAAFSPL